MSELIIHPTERLQGEVTPPSSKSQSIRGLLFCLLAEGQSELFNLLDSEDVKAALAVCTALGATIEQVGAHFTIKSQGLPLATNEAYIHTLQSGITTLFTLPLLGLRAEPATPITLDADAQMRARPIHSLVDALRHLGLQIDYLEQPGRLPLKVSGSLRGGVASVDGITSQYLSALLISLPCAAEDSIITVKHLQERPYVAMTLEWLDAQGIAYSHHQQDDVDIYHITGRQRYKPRNALIQGDYSSASCLIAAAVLSPGEVVLQGLYENDIQGDKRLIALLQSMGAAIQVSPQSLRITGQRPLTGIRIDANDIPDLVPALAVIATQAQGKTEITNVAQARIKETDRLHSMTEGLRRMGAQLDEHIDGLTVYPSTLHGARVQSYGDHRTVMALAVAGLLASGTTVIEGADAIKKTFPNYVETLRALGANMQLNAQSHVILIGFKHVGKSLLGKHLALAMALDFIDFDQALEMAYQRRYQQTLSCRHIMQLIGEAAYRALETEVLQRVLATPRAVIALGGGTPLQAANQQLLASQTILHVLAPKGIVFERIMVSGRPAFFTEHEDPYVCFMRLWEERERVYQQLATHTIENNGPIEHVVQAAREALL